MNGLILPISGVAEGRICNEQDFSVYLFITINFLETVLKTSRMILKIINWPEEMIFFLNLLDFIDITKQKLHISAIY